MSFSARKARVLAAITAMSLYALPTWAQETRPNLDACLSASDQGQVLRDGGKYVAARTALRTCAQASCPAVVQRNCARWLAEVEAGLPSVVFAAKGPDGNPVVGDTSVHVDGTLVLERLTGTPTPIDPGSHSVVFRSGERVSELQTLVNVGERNRLIVAQFRAPPPPPASSTAPPLPPPSPPPEPPARSESKAGVAPVAVGAAGLAGIAIFAFLGSTALSDLHALERSPCAPSHTCDAGDMSSIRTRFAVGDIALGAGVIALGVAAWLWWTHK